MSENQKTKPQQIVVNDDSQTVFPTNSINLNGIANTVSLDEMFGSTAKIKLSSTESSFLTLNQTFNASSSIFGAAARASSIGSLKVDLNQSYRISGLSTEMSSATFPSKVPTVADGLLTKSELNLFSSSIQGTIDEKGLISGSLTINNNIQGNSILPIKSSEAKFGLSAFDINSDLSSLNVVNANLNPVIAIGDINSKLSVLGTVSGSYDTAVNLFSSGATAEALRIKPSDSNHYFGTTNIGFNSLLTDTISCNPTHSVRLTGHVNSDIAHIINPDYGAAVQVKSYAEIDITSRIKTEIEKSLKNVGIDYSFDELEIETESKHGTTNLYLVNSTINFYMGTNSKDMKVTNNITGKGDIISVGDNITNSNIGKNITTDSHNTTSVGDNIQIFISKLQEELQVDNEMIHSLKELCAPKGYSEESVSKWGIELLKVMFDQYQSLSTGASVAFDAFYGKFEEVVAFCFENSENIIELVRAGVSAFRG